VCALTDGNLGSHRQVIYDLVGVFAIVFLTDVLMSDFFVQFYLASIFLWAILPLFVELAVRKGSIRNLGFLRTNFSRSLSLYLALAVGWVFVASVLFVYFGVSTPVGSSVGLALFFLYPAFVEELNFRGFLQTRLERLFSLRTAVLIQALVFALYHVPAVLPISKLGFSPGGLFYPVLVFPFALVLGVVYAKTRNLFVTMALHGSLLASFFVLSAFLA
jgi:membrane protease YdiL (CAAX protease family)